VPAGFMIVVIVAWCELNHSALTAGVCFPLVLNKLSFPATLQLISELAILSSTVAVCIITQCPDSHKVWLQAPSSEKKDILLDHTTFRKKIAGHVKA
jgi:hypothetical protein